MLTPKLLTTLRGYDRRQFASDLVAGVVVGVVAIPLAIAFGIASGVSPDRGLVTAVVAGLLISALGGSRVQIGGPTGAFVIIVYGIVQKYGVDGLIVATIMAGVLLIIMGLARFGAVVKFIPRSVVVGFTSGIALVIFSSQAKDFLGLPLEEVPVEFFAKWYQLSLHARDFNPYALGIGAGTVAIVALWPRVSRRVPGSLVALVAASAAAAYFRWPVETIGSRFGELPHGLPAPRLPMIDLEDAQKLFQPAFTIALLGAIESLLSAVVADGMIGSKHRSNMELVAQGAANVGSGLFGGIPATGAIARTVTNIKNGGRTPVAGIVHALTVLGALLLFGPWIRLVPMACLAGILVVVSYHMSEWRSYRSIARGSREAALVLVTTFAVTVLIDLTAAIQLGVVLSAFIFVRRMSEVKNVRLITGAIDDEDPRSERPIMNYPVPDGVEIYEIDGPIFFGSADQLDEIDRIVSRKPKVRILRFRNVPFIDSTGLHALEAFHRKCRQGKIRLLVTGLHVQPLNEMVKSDLYDLIGADNVFGSTRDAIERARQLI